MSDHDRETRSGEASTRRPDVSRSTTGNASPTDAAHEVDNPFATPGTQTPHPDPSPLGSRPESATGSHGSSSGYQYFPRGAYFRSRRVKKGEIERPWMEKKDPREKWMTIIPLIGFFLGCCVVGVLVWDGVRSVAVHKYCEVLNEDFSSWNSNIWTKEVEVGGYGSVNRQMIPCNLRLTMLAAMANSR
jgi:hypothetical protein